MDTETNNRALKTALSQPRFSTSKKIQEIKFKSNDIFNMKKNTQVDSSTGKALFKNRFIDNKIFTQSVAAKSEINPKGKAVNSTKFKNNEIFKTEPGLIETKTKSVMSLKYKDNKIFDPSATQPITRKTKAFVESKSRNSDIFFTQTKEDISSPTKKRVRKGSDVDYFSSDIFNANGIEKQTFLKRSKTQKEFKFTDHNPSNTRPLETEPVEIKKSSNINGQKSLNRKESDIFNIKNNKLTKGSVNGTSENKGIVVYTDKLKSKDIFLREKASKVPIFEKGNPKKKGEFSDKFTSNDIFNKIRQKTPRPIHAKKTVNDKNYVDNVVFGDDGERKTPVKRTFHKGGINPEKYKGTSEIFVERKEPFSKALNSGKSPFPKKKKCNVETNKGNDIFANGSGQAKLSLLAFTPKSNPLIRSNKK